MSFQADMIPLAQLSEHLEASVDAVVERLTLADQGVVGALGDELAVYYRGAGVAGLLIDYDPNRYHHMLTRSGLMRCFVLSRLEGAGAEAARYRKVSNARSLFDVMAVDRFDLAKRIVERSPSEWTQKYEYEDDYWYARLLGLLAGGVEGEELGVAVDSFEASLVGTPAPRFDVCKALLESKEGGFGEAFQALLEYRSVEVEREAKSLSRDEVDFAAGRHVFVEGLALLRLAERRGIPTEPEYAYCPAEARGHATVPFPDDRYPRQRYDSGGSKATRPPTLPGDRM